jgi:hypothetical protein
MADYTLHLGFRWGGPAIGAILGTGAALPHDARFLQFALASAGGVAAWFQFQPQDTLSVKIWDLSSSSAPAPSGFALGLDMSFGPLDGDGSYQTLSPGTLVTGEGQTITKSVGEGKTSALFAFDDVSSTSDRGDCPWGSARRCYAAGRVTLTAADSYELGFILTVSYQGARQYFVADPEVIVGSAGGGSGGGGMN